MILIFALFAGFFGSALGSFLGAAYYRLPRRIAMTGRSHCPNCGKQLSWFDNIPIFSWLILGGKSRCCNNKISVHYLLFEVGCFLLGAGVFLGLQAVLNPEAAFILVIIISFVVIAVVSLVSTLRSKRAD